MVGTLAHPPPRGSRSTPREAKVKSVWEALPGQITDASSKFGGAKKGLKVTFIDGDVMEVPAAELGPSCDDDSWKTWEYAGGPQWPSAPPTPSRVPAGGAETSTKKKKDKKKLSPYVDAAAQLSVPTCWIADTGCGFDLLCMKWVDETDRKRLSKPDNPMLFSGVGGTKAAELKLRLNIPAIGV